MFDLSKFVNKLKLGKHYRMERFGVEFVSLIILLIVCASVCFVTSVNKSRTALVTNAIYTTKFTTSRTQASGTVEGVYKSGDEKGCMVILHFDDITKVSTDAANYQMFLTSADVSGNPAVMTYAPSGSIYMFGSSGYMGIYLYSTTGFDAQILDLVVRCNSEIVPAQGASTANKDASFDKYDQFRVYFNPGGLDATIAACLNDNDFTLFDIYEELICRSKEQTIRNALNTDLEKLRVDLNAISEYENRLANINIDGASIVVPDRPEYIAGDSIEKREDGQLIYHCEQVVGRGVNYDWWDGSIQNGYLQDVIPDGMTYVSWLTALNKESSSFSVSDIKWYLTDGTLWNDYNSANGSIGPAKDINNTINSLLSAYQTYYNDKRTYQTNDLRNLLNLELEARNVEMNYTINSSESVLRLY